MHRFGRLMLPPMVLAAVMASSLICVQAAADDAATCERAAGADAISACSRLIASDRDKGSALAKVYRNRCAAWNHDHEPDRALADCSEALRLDTGQVAARTGRGDAYRLMRDFDRAIAEYSEAIRLDPKNAGAFWGRCSGWTNKNNLDRALPECNAAIGINAKYAPPYATRCLIMTFKRDYDRAATDCDQAIQLDPKHAPGYNARGVLLRSKRDYDHALADFDQAIQLDPKLANAYHNRGQTWLDKRDYDRAISDYSELIKLEPRNVNAYADRCLALYQKKAFDRALKDCDQAIEIDPKLAYLFNRRGLIWVEQRDFDRAIADYTQAIRINSKYAVAYFNRGAAWSGRRELDRAVADFGEAITLNPRYTDAYMRRAYAYKQKRDYDRAIADYDQAVALNPKNVFAFASRGVAWLDRPDYNRALADFDEAIRLDPDYTGAWTNKGLALERKGDVEQARKSFDAALALPEKYRDGKWAHDTARERVAALPSPQSPAQASEGQTNQQGSGSRPPQRSSIERGPRVALLVANSAYPDADPPLTQTKKDTVALADEIKRMGFDTEIAENLTKLGMQRAIENFKKKTKPGAIALLYFNGFGLQSNRQTYLLPTDAQIWNEADVRRDGTNLETVLDELNREGAAVKIAIIDASRRTPYERRFRSSAAGLAPINIAKDSLVIYSVGVGQTSGETAGEQGLFTTELLKEMRAPGVSAEEVFARTRVGVSRGSDADQVPWVASSLVESVYFVPSGNPTAQRGNAR